MSSDTATVPGKRFSATSAALWFVQALLALAFLPAGVMKATAPYEQVAKAMAWAAATPPWLVKFIGVAEFLGALGLLLPALTRIRPALTPWAATGLAIIMGLAAILHVYRAEYAIVPVNVALGGLAAFVAWGRFRKAPIPPRT